MVISFIPVGKAGSKSKEDAPYELESQFILRLPTVRLLHWFKLVISVNFTCEYFAENDVDQSSSIFQEYASTVRRIAQSSSMNMKDRLTIELHRKIKSVVSLSDGIYTVINIKIHIPHR